MLSPGPGPGLIGRRRLLRSALAGAVGLGLLGPGCARGQPAAAPSKVAAPVALTVASHHLLPAAASLAGAWAASGHTGTLTFTSDTGPPPTYIAPTPGYFKADVAENSGDGAMIDGPAAWVNLAPLLRQTNFDLHQLPASAVQAFSLGGDIFGLPLALDPFVMLVNDARLAQIGVSHPAGQPWTLAEMQVAVAAANAAPGVTGTTPLINGQGTDVRLWGAFMLGSGGSLLDGSGALSLAGEANVRATKALIDLAAAARWPGRREDPGAARLVYDGFAGDAAQTLFAIEPDYPNQLRSVGPTGPANRFPLLPSDPLIPAYEVGGLGVPAHAAHPEASVAFILWLYAPEQQGLLLSKGIPPVVAGDPALLAQWSAEQPGGQDISSLFDPEHMIDILGLLPQTGYVVWRNYDGYLQQALLAGAAQPATIAANLLAAQQALSASTAQVEALTLCTLSHTDAAGCPPLPGAQAQTGGG